MAFRDRTEAGRVLARKLSAYTGRPDVVVLGLARGGVPVAAQVALALGAALDVFVVRKLGLPGREELAMGAIASGGAYVINQDVVAAAGVSPQVIAEVIRKESAELARREQLYRHGRPAVEVENKTVILVDDGLATGATMRAAAAALRARRAGAVVAAFPVGATEPCQELSAHVDDLVCAVCPDVFFSVGSWYDDFSQTSDEEVTAALELDTGSRARAV